MLQILNLGLIFVLVLIIFIYIIKIAQDIKKLRHKGKVFYTARRQANEIIALAIIMSLNCWLMYRAQMESKVGKGIIVIFGMTTIGYWFYSGFSRPRLCEHIIITPNYIYLTKDIIGYKWSSLMEEEGTTKLWIKVVRKFIFGKDKVKEVHFILKNEQIPEIEAFLNAKKRNS